MGEGRLCFELQQWLCYWLTMIQKMFWHAYCPLGAEAVDVKLLGDSRGRCNGNHSDTSRRCFRGDPCYGCHCTNFRSCWGRKTRRLGANTPPLMPNPPYTSCRVLVFSFWMGTHFPGWYCSVVVEESWRQEHRVEFCGTRTASPSNHWPRTHGRAARGW